MGAGSCNSSSTNSSSIVGLQGPPLTPRLPQISRGPSQGPPKSAATPTAAPGVTVATAHIDAVQVPARPGSASTVADLVREAIEAGEAAEYEPDSYGVIREADEGFAEDDLLDFTEDSRNWEWGVYCFRCRVDRLGFGVGGRPSGRR